MIVALSPFLNWAKLAHCTSADDGNFLSNQNNDVIPPNSLNSKSCVSDVFRQTIAVCWLQSKRVLRMLYDEVMSITLFSFIPIHLSLCMYVFQEPSHDVRSVLWDVAGGISCLLPRPGQGSAYVPTAVSISVWYHYNCYIDHTKRTYTAPPVSGHATVETTSVFWQLPNSY